MEKNVIIEAARCRTCGKIVSIDGYKPSSENEERICGECYHHLLYPTTGNGLGPMSG